MNKTRHNTLRVLGLLTAVVMLLPAVMFTSCKKTVGPTTVWIEDSVRHYFPVVLGEEVRQVWVIHNTGKENLIITDVQPSNGSIELTSAEPGIITPGGEEKLFFTFHSEKNVGFAEHSIRIFGNIEPDGVKEMKFDIHIVRPTLERSDYEEYYNDHISDAEREAFNKGELNKGYYVDEDSSFITGQRDYKKYIYR